MNDPVDTNRGLVCQDLVERVTDFLDGALSPDENRAIETHLRECDGCVHHLEQFRIAIRLARATADDAVEVAPETMSALADAFRTRRPTAGDHPG